MVIKEVNEKVIEVELTGGELDKLIDAEAQARLGMSGADFKGQYQRGELSDDDPRVRVLATLLRLAA